MQHRMFMLQCTLGHCDVQGKNQTPCNIECSCFSVPQVTVMFRGRAESHATDNVDHVSVYLRSPCCLGEELDAMQQRTLIVFQCTLGHCDVGLRCLGENCSLNVVVQVSTFLQSCSFLFWGKSWKPRNRKCCSCFSVDAMQQRMLIMFQCTLGHCGVQAKLFAKRQRCYIRCFLLLLLRLLHFGRVSFHTRTMTLCCIQLYCSTLSHYCVALLSFKTARES